MALSLLQTLPALLIALYILKRSTSKPPTSHPLPPGPKGIPLLGSALSVDAAKPWVTYAQWGQLYGDLVHARIMNMDVIIINSAKVARDLIDLRSSIYSDRPKLATIEPYGIATGTIFMPYGDTWRLHRRIFHQSLNSEAAHNYWPMQTSKARQLVINLADDPENFVTHFHTLATSVIMAIMYGHNTAPKNDPYVEYAETGMKAIVKAGNPKKAAALALFPFLLKLPSWVPGSLKAEAAEAKFYADGFRKVLFGIATEKMASGTDVPSMIIDALKRNQANGNLPEVTDAIRNASSAAYGAASETTAFSLDTFTCAMVLFPEAQKKAQKEIDEVVGTDRLPNFSDRPSLPFVEALLREVERWHPVGPTGLPHATAVEDVYEGMYIPKGATVLVNTWGIFHNPKTYPEPSKFKPERFIREDGTLNEDNVPAIFGYGRRICPGRHAGDASLWISIVSMLACFEFLKSKDEHGNDIDFEPEFTPGTTSRPKHFPCRIVPRRPIDEIKELVSQDPEFR